VTCYFEGKAFSEGALSCQNGREFKCRGGEWEPTGYECGAAPTGSTEPEAPGSQGDADAPSSDNT
jgi:hypothetical protein